jgi:hypothetical protein
MAHVEGATMPLVFADHGVVIIEDFAPYIFRGKDAVILWNAGSRSRDLLVASREAEWGAIFYRPA